MPERRVRVTKPGFPERRISRKELADHIASGWVPVWDQSVETLSTQVAVLRDAVVDLAGQVEGAGSPDPSEPGDPAGSNGKSAYELAVDAGFSGTVQEWLASLVGPPGPPSTTPGPPGADSTVPGPPGADGKSAYQLARDAGYGGTQTQWLASLVGAKGDKGDPGNTGAPGPNNARRAVVQSAALTANTAKTIPVTWPSALPDANYSVGVVVEHATPNQFNCSVLPGSRTTTGCSVVVRSTAAVSAPGVNVHVQAIA